MKSSVRISFGILVVLAISLIGCDARDRLRLIRRITASDLPTTLNQTNLANNTSPGLVNKAEALVTNVSASNPVPKEGSGDETLHPTEILRTSAATHRRQRSTTTVAPDVSSTTPPSNSSASPTVRKPYVRTNRTNVIRSKKLSNCTVGAGENSCEQKVASNEIKPVVELSNANSTQDTKTEDTNKKSSKDKLQETSTDRTFNNIVSSSTARIVIQENIHTDILRHLTTMSYAHYEADYVMDDDPYEAESHQSTNKEPSTNKYEEYAKQGDHSNYNVTYTPPSSKLFDEAYARVSEGIRQNLDDIEEKSEEYEHFSSSSDDEATVLSEGLPKNDSKVSLQFLNHVNVISNDSASANSKHGDLFIDNGTHVQLERSFIETKVTPEVSSTVKYLIDDEYSTTRRIPTDKDEEDNNVKESVGSSSQHIDQEGAEDSGVATKIQQRDNTITTRRQISNKNNTILSAVKTDTKVPTLSNKTVPVKDYESFSPSGISVESTSPTGPSGSRATSGTTVRSSNRSRMYSSERNPIYNTNNTVEEGVTERAESKRVRSRLSLQNASTTDATLNTRSRLYSSRTASTGTPATARSYDASGGETWVTSPRTNIIRSRRPIASTTGRPESNPQNSEGNDILANDNYRLATQRGAVKFGNLRNAEQSEQFPIPPTAAAWSLVTMKEPGRRTRLSSTQTTTPISDTSDSEASGSFSKGTTIYNILAPNSFFSNSTSPSKYVDSNTSQNKFSTSPDLTTKTHTRSDNGIATTPYPDADVTSTQSSITESEESFTTQQPYEPTTLTSVENDENISNVEEERFDVSRHTTLSPISGSSPEVTTPNADSFPTTTELYETTRLPKELGDKIVEEETEEEDTDSVITTTELAVLDLEPGIADDSHRAVPNSAADVATENRQENKAVETESKKTVGEDGPHASKDFDVESKIPEGVGKKEAGGVRTLAEGTNQEDVQSVVEEDSDYGGPSGTEVETEATNIVGGNIPSNKEAKNTTQAANTTVQVETSMLPPSENSTSSVDHATTIQEISDIHTFIRLFVEAPMQEFCELIPQFKKAVADRLTEGTGRTITEKQVILRNIGSEQCSNLEETNTTAKGELMPVEMHVVNERGNYDQQLNDAFPLLWGHLDLDFPLRIRKVDVIDESLAYATNNGNGAVIAAITISCIAAICLLILAVLLVVMRKRQKKVNYGMRCTPVSLDAYSLDSVSVHGSVRRKGGVRASKRSYGNPAFDDPGSPTNPMNFASLANFVNNRDAIDEEFGHIPHVTPKSDELPEGAETKNRYANVIPLPETRVVLTVQGEEPLSDYINANYVTGPKNAPRYYIACQAPMQSTVNDFWRMIWEKQSKVIIMLTDFVENGVEKCADYLPPSEVIDCHRLFGDYQVTLKKREVREMYVISTLQLKNMESNSWREVVHLWYAEWPGQGVPEDPSSVIALLIEARAYTKPGGGGGPCVVHCSPGTGRTGTVLACDMCIRDFEQSRTVDVPRCVARLRKDRAGCVQTRDQYAFIYQVLNLYATKLTGGALDESI